MGAIGAAILAFNHIVSDKKQLDFWAWILLFEITKSKVLNVKDAQTIVK